jgi:putative hydrolase of HD superfamily
MNDTDRLNAQMAFLCEVDKLKSVLRATRLHDKSRFENSAEHSWHIALYAMVLAEQAPDCSNPFRVIKMLLIHDIVEIDAGDAPIHGVFDKEEMALKEKLAADRLFNLLPIDQAHEFRALWDEFEAAQTPDARFAKALDRIPSPLANMANGGGSWTDYDVSEEDLDRRVGVPIQAGAPELWKWLKSKIGQWFKEHTPTD